MNAVAAENLVRIADAMHAEYGNHIYLTHKAVKTGERAPTQALLRLATEIAAALNPWQPMDSAPKGGEIILLAAINDHHVMVREARWDAGRKDWAGWAHIADIQPNYWMPLPAPPTDTGAQS